MADSEADRPLRSFLVECYASQIEPAIVARDGARLDRAAGELRLAGRPISYVRAVAVPDDEVVFHLFVARDTAVVRATVSRAGVACERIVESIVVDAAASPAPIPGD